ncbi:unnamed protein product [Paramecium pentaurelia]|uniref:non-specific serine/threonine protein kinase n=1 Tax=Paramecium pentaurelia TaxID=43138 RepID=A0A8S1SGX8_9CILI|nr:unnamed protein product [Paramecium pentaurelia]
MQQQRINNYSILKELGKGANGQVYLAIKDEDKKEYALKLQQFEISNYELAIIDELKSYQLFNIAKSYEKFVYKLGFMEYDCIVMDYCNNGDLSDYLKINRKYLNIQDIRDMIFQIAFGIWELHNFKIIHRDLKPQNILTHKQDKLFLKICDLGLSKISKQGGGNHTVNIGTPYYMAPELIQNDDSDFKNYDCSVDVWALGVIIYEFFSEEQLFAGRNISMIFDQIKNLDIKEKLNKIYDLDLRNICEKCLYKNPNKRPKIEQILIALDEIKFEKQKQILQNDSTNVQQSQIKIKSAITTIQQNLYQENNQKLNEENKINNSQQINYQEEPQNKMIEKCSQLQPSLNPIQIRLQVQILSKIKDKKFANQLIFMYWNKKSEEEILKVLQAKGNELIVNSQKLY